MTESDVTTTPTDVPNPQDEVQKTVNGKAEWTIMIYMAGDNNLADDCVNALKSMQQVKTGNIIHVIAQFDPSDTRVSTQRLVLNLKDKNVGDVVTKPAVPSPSTLAQDDVEIEEGTVKFDSISHAVRAQMDPGETDTADPKTLFDFISWSQEIYEAEHYMLVLAGHSSGVEDGYLLKDENPSHSMSLNGLMQVFSQVKAKLPKVKLDILGMDSCLMSMIEICYELQSLDLIDVLVSSQSTTPNPGWPYSEILTALIEAGGKLNADQLAPILVNKYVNSYVENAVNSGLATDLSALKVGASKPVATSIKQLGTALRNKMGQGSDAEFNRALIHAHWEAQSYNGELFVDLADLCDLLEKYCNDAGVNIAVKAVRDAMTPMVLAACFCGIDYQYSNGISIYFPWSKIFSYYQNLTFARDADWFSFLADYVEATRRPPRGGEAHGPSQKFIIRRDPPYNHGPIIPASSMRNPPRKWSKNGIKDCIEFKKEWGELFDSFQ